MNSVESSPIELLEEQAEGVRCFVIRLKAPHGGLHVRANIGLSIEHQEAIRERCAVLNLSFEAGLPLAAASEIISRLYGDEWPDEDPVESIEEVSREEMLRSVRERNALIQSSGD